MKTQIYGLMIIILTLVMFPISSFAHPGRTDSSGCHTCKTNCPNWGLSYGEYHCHNAKALPQPEEPIRSHYGEGGTGTTELWPTYQNGSVSSKTSLRAIPTKITTNLKRGMSNEEVKLLQTILARDSVIYPEAVISGYFGVATEKAVRRLQKNNGLEQVGSTGPRTRAILNAM